MKVFIVEDEIPAQEELARVLKKHFPDISISGAEGSVKGATEWLEKKYCRPHIHGHPAVRRMLFRHFQCH